jgi:hypothetical protein
MTRIIAVTSLLLFSVHAFAAEIINRPGGPSWPSGVGQIFVPDGYNAWKDWTGYDVDIATVWTAVEMVLTWDDFENGNKGAYFNNTMDAIPKSTPIILSYPMVPKSISNKDCENLGMWDDFAAGKFDGHYRTFARNFNAIVKSKGRDPANHVIRLGWEMNGNWYPWSICNKVKEFKQSWERAVNILRTEIPGIIIDFSPARPYVGFTGKRSYNGTPGINLEGFLPAENSYDVISRSHHDARPEVTSEETWQEHLRPAASKKEIGLLDLVEAGRAHGKKIALTEWATQMDDCTPRHVKAPNPALFIQKTYEFLAENAANVAWDTHFSIGCTQLYGRQNTSAAETYRSLWGSGSGGGSVIIDSGGGSGSSPARPNPPQNLVAD